jgi:MFS transporter, DHA1 family, multidrug resistance protein
LIAVADDHWHKTLWAMLCVQFIISGAFSIVPPVIALVLPTLGVTEPGAVRGWAGVLVGVTPLAAALMSPQWGRIADRIDRRIVILIACGSASICSITMSVATNPWELLALRFTMGLFGGHVAAGLSIVSAATPLARMGWALGLLASAQLAGTLTGPLLGGLIADAFSSYRAPFVLAGVAVLLVAGAVAFVPPQTQGSRPVGDRLLTGSTLSRTEISHVRGSERSRALVSESSRVPGSEGSRVPAEDPRVLGSKGPRVHELVIVLLLVQCAIMMTQPVISLHVRELVGEPANLATLAGLAFSVVALSGLLAAPLLGSLSDRVGARRLLFFMLCAAAILVLPQAYAQSYRWFVGERFFAGLFLCSLIPIANSLVGHTVRAEDRGRVYGLTSAAAFLGAFVGPVSGGLIGAHFGLTSVFVVSAVLLLIAMVWVSVTLWPWVLVRL